MDAASKQRLSKVHPELAKRVTATIRDLNAEGHDVRVVQGLRTYAEQDALYAQGRTRKGAKVTNARGGFSNHNFGLAVDLCPFKSGQPDWNDNKAFNAIGAAGKANGLSWGGDWKSIVDKPHLELPTGLSTKACRDLYAAGGLNAVWKRASEKLGIPFSNSAAASDAQTLTGNKSANAQTIPNSLTQDTQPTGQPPPTQIAENIINAGEAPAPPPEDKVLPAPPKEGATATSTKMVIAGVTIPPIIAGILKAISDAIQQGFVDAHEIGTFLLGFLRDNIKWVLLLVGLLIVLLIVKKIIKTVTFWLEMISHMVPKFNNVTVVPSETPQPEKHWYEWWK